MAKVFWKGGALLAPVPPALVSCSDGERQNLLTVAWTGILNTVPPKTYISVRPSRFSYSILCQSGGFVINLPTESLVRVVDFCGCRSGRDLDKFDFLHLETDPSPVLGLPMLRACPVCLECRIFERRPLGSHDMFLADIVGVSVEERFLSASGKLRLDKAGLLGYCHGSYYGL